MASSNTSTAVKLMLIIVAALVLFGLLTYYNRTKIPSAVASHMERFSADQRGAIGAAGSGSGGLQGGIRSAPIDSVATTAAAFGPSHNEPLTNEKYRAVGAPDGAGSPKDPFPQDRISPEELLPRDAANSKFAQVNPAGQGDVQNMNFLTAGHHMGVNTTGQSLRNASHDLRSDIPNPRYKVSVWQQSTIQPDLNRRPLE